MWRKRIWCPKSLRCGKAGKTTPNKHFLFLQKRNESWLFYKLWFDFSNLSALIHPRQLLQESFSFPSNPGPSMISMYNQLTGRLPLRHRRHCEVFYFPCCPTWEFSRPWSPILHLKMHSHLSFLSRRFGLGTSPLYILLSRKILSIKWILRHTMGPGDRALSVNQGVPGLFLSVR